ncbi:MAG: GNAT family N-acetyltransferase [Planctomycetes bacterium]|nr:GNAT family N-acetyltransferase [Planctomycetota bacterium]
MRLVELRDRVRIEEFLRRDTPLHVYEIGDLDPFFWPATTWYGIEDEPAGLRAIALIYTTSDNVTLLAFSRDDPEAVERLIDRIQASLPQRFHAHLSPGLMDRLTGAWQASHLSEAIKMHLPGPDRLMPCDTRDVQRLSAADLGEVETFYAAAYPGNWFDARMLRTDQYFGIRRGGKLACVAGVHVYSRALRVAALGNIATLPQYRRQGLARRATARLCQSLLQDVDTLGLNVHCENRAAVACYASLGFETVAPYVEAWFARF